MKVSCSPVKLFADVDLCLCASHADRSFLSSLCCSSYVTDCSQISVVLFLRGFLSGFLRGFLRGPCTGEQHTLHERTPTPTLKVEVTTSTRSSGLLSSRWHVDLVTEPVSVSLWGFYSVWSVDSESSSQLLLQLKHMK